MYTILIKSNNEMIVSTPEQRIMQRSKLVDTLHFLTAPTYNGLDMSTCTLLLEYKLPVSQEPHSEILTLSNDLYKENLEYKLPLDTSITKEAGRVEMQVTFLKNEMNSDGSVSQYTRKISPCFVNIIPIAAWSNMVPDAELAAIDQRILKLDAIANQLSEMQDVTFETKADDISYENNTIQLLANGKKIGTSHILDQQEEMDIIEFGDNGDENPDSPNDDDHTLVEF